MKKPEKNIDLSPAEDIPFVEEKEGKKKIHVRQESANKDIADMLDLLETPAENTGKFDDLGINENGRYFEPDDFDEETEFTGDEEETQDIDYSQAARLNTELIDAISSTAWGVLSGENPETFMLSPKSKKNIAAAMVPLLEKYGGSVSPEFRFIVIFLSAQSVNYMTYRAIRSQKVNAIKNQGKRPVMDNIYAAGDGAGLETKTQKPGVTVTRKPVTHKEKGPAAGVPQTCGYCGELGHNKRTCQYKKADRRQGINRATMPEDERISKGILQG